VSRQGRCKKKCARDRWMDTATGPDDLPRITQRGVIRISDDNAAHTEDYLRDEGLRIFTGLSVTRLVDSGYS